jgi:hypothetical protein
MRTIDLEIKRLKALKSPAKDKVDIRPVLEKLVTDFALDEDYKRELFDIAEKEINDLYGRQYGHNIM